MDIKSLNSNIKPGTPPNVSVETSLSSGISLSAKKPSSSVKTMLASLGLGKKVQDKSLMSARVPIDILNDVLAFLPTGNIKQLKLVSKGYRKGTEAFLKKEKRSFSPVKMIEFYLSQGNRKAAFQYFKDHINTPGKTQEKLELLVQMAVHPDMPDMIDQLKYRTPRFFRTLKDSFILDEKTKLFRKCRELILAHLENEHFMFLEIDVIKNKDPDLYESHMETFFFSEDEKNNFRYQAEKNNFRSHFRFLKAMNALGVCFFNLSHGSIEEARSDMSAYYNLYRIEKMYYDASPRYDMRLDLERPSNSYCKKLEYMGSSDFLYSYLKDFCYIVDRKESFAFFVKKLIRENCEKQLYDQAARWIYAVGGKHHAFLKEYIVPLVAGQHKSSLLAAYAFYSSQPLQEGSAPTRSA